MEKTYRMKNLDCANCAQKIERAIKKIKGIENATINFMTLKLLITAENDNFEELLPLMQAVVDKIEPGTKILA